jgi:hypothetical protein
MADFNIFFSLSLENLRFNDILNQLAMLSASLVGTAWGSLSLQIEETVGSCKYGG